MWCGIVTTDGVKEKEQGDNNLTCLGGLFRGQSWTLFGANCWLGAQGGDDGNERCDGVGDVKGASWCEEMIYACVYGAENNEGCDR